MKILITDMKHFFFLRVRSTQQNGRRLSRKILTKWIRLVLARNPITNFGVDLLKNKIFFI